MKFSQARFVFLFFLMPILSKAGPMPDSLAKLDVYAILGKASQVSWKNLDAALAINEVAVEKASAARDFMGLFYAYHERGVYFEEHNRPLNALPEYEKALFFADSCKDSREQFLSSIFTELAIVNRKAGNYAACKNWHESALRLAQKIGNAELEEDSYHGLGFLYETTGEWERAIEFYQKSITVAERRKSTTGVIVTTQNIAKTLLRAGNRELALKKIEEAWGMAIQQPDTMRRAHVLNDYGEILTNIGQFELAEQKFKTSLLAYEQLGDLPMKARAFLNLGNVFSKKGDDSTALDFFKKSLTLKESLRPEDLVNLFAHTAELFQKRHELDGAAANWGECLALSQQLNFRDVMQKAHLALSKIADEKNQPDIAFFHLKRATAIGDSLTGQQKDLKLAEMEFKFDAARAEKKLADLKDQRARMMFTGALVLLGLGFLFQIYRNRERTRSNRILSQKNGEIERQNHKLQESNMILQQFAWASAHDLKEPLRTIGSFIGLIQKRHGHALPAEAVEYMQFVKDGAHRMNSLLSDLLEYSTLCAEDATTHEITPLHRVLRDVMGNLRETIRARKAIIELPPEMPSLAMQRSHLVQLFQNLVSNGIKFSPENPHVTVNFYKELNGDLLFAIRDNGIGIDKAYEGKVFQVFHRLQKNQFEGTGIGLAICKNIVDKYGGQIWFESEIGSGTAFFLRFPAELEVAPVSEQIGELVEN